MPDYLAKVCVLVARAADRRLLRSANTEMSLAPRATTAIGRRSFGVFGLKAWNKLPVHMCATTDAATFTRVLRNQLVQHLVTDKLTHAFVLLFSLHIIN